MLKSRETKLIGQLDELAERKLKDVASQKDDIETRLAQLNSSLYFIRESLRSGHKDDVLLMKTRTLNQVMELAAPIQGDISKSSTGSLFSLVKSYFSMSGLWTGPFTSSTRSFKMQLYRENGCSGRRDI